MATETSKPQVKKGTGTEQLPQGAATQLNRQLELVPSPEAILQNAAEEPQPQGEVTNFDDVLFAGTDHPNEPITQGVPFGPGANFTRQGPETDREFLSRAAADIASAPNATARVRSFAARVARGE